MTKSKNNFMTMVTKKRTLFAGFLSVAAFIIMASCGNDTGSAKSAEQPAPDTSTAVAPGAETKPVAKKRKPSVSGMVRTDNTMKMEKDKEGVYSRAEKMPEYPGGEAALSKFVENNINYPQDAVDQDAEGTVNVSFVVDEKGRVTHPLVSGKSAGHGLDEAAMQVIKQMPSWKPGTVKGKPVKTRLLLPVTFKLA